MSNPRFRPVRGTEEKILKASYHEGYLYFATDTGNIFIDANNEKVPMGGRGAAVLYADTTAVQGSDDDYYTIYIDGLVDEDINPKVDDLIINSDGAFYRINSVNDSLKTMLCTRIAVSGSGSGSGSGGSSSSVVYARGRLTATNNGEVDILNGSQCTFNILATSATEDGVPIDGDDEALTLNISYTVSGNSTPYYKDSMRLTHGVAITYDATDYLRESTETILTFVVSGSESDTFYSSGKVERTVATHSLSIEWVSSQFSSINYFKDSVVPHVHFSTGARRIVDIYFDDYLVYTEFFDATSNTSSTNLTITSNSETYNLNGSVSGTLGNAYSHGRHTIKAVLSLAKADKSRGTSADPITKEIATYVTPGEPLIWFGDVQESYYAYDNPIIPIRIYDPSAENTSNVPVYLYIDGVDALDGSYYTSDNDSNEYLYWTLTDLEAGQTTIYQVKVGENEHETWETVPTFEVLEDNRHMGIVTTNMLMNFDSRTRSNSESSKSRSLISVGSSYATLSDFNWYNNGWIMDDDNVTCLRISNGASVSFPIGSMIFGGSGSVTSHTIEMRLKIRNVQTYDKLITNYTRYKVSTDVNTTIADTTDKSWTDGKKIYIEDNAGACVYIGGKFVDDDGTHTDEQHYTYTSVFEAFLAQKDKGISNYDAYLTKMLPIIQETQISVPTYDELGYDDITRQYNLKSAMLKYIKNEDSPNTEAAICLGPQDGYFSNGTNSVTVDYVEDEIINLTIVYEHGSTDFGNDKLMKFYLNGMLTSVARSDASGSWSINTPNLVISSDGCDIDLYKFRIYNSALGLNEILQNVAYDNLDTTAWDLASLYYQGTSVNEPFQFSYNSMINYNKTHLNNQIMPYLLFTTDETDATAKGKLPWRKDTPVKANVEFINPALDRAYDTGELSALADKAGISVEDYYKYHCPSWIAEDCDMSVQGTSSEFYPRRNYKVKTKVAVPVVDDNGATSVDEYGDKVTSDVYEMKFHKGPYKEAYEAGEAKNQKFFYYDNETVGTNKFTLKVDYMESSGSYNMGLANMVNTAYSHHPLSDYNGKNAFVTGVAGVATELTAYPENQLVWYRNHKGNWKLCLTGDTEKDTANETTYGDVLGEITVASAEDFAKGVWALAAEQNVTKVLGGQKKVAPTEEAAEENFLASREDTTLTWDSVKDYVNKWFAYTPGSLEAITVGNLEDYRTSVQGFPTLAFYQTKAMAEADEEPLFIGRYNMLVDKGSAEVYGFKLGSKYQQAFIDGNPAVADIAECWEFENNSRGFCSFRDPWNRKELSFRAPEGASNEFTSNGAPIVADYFEYRYNANDDYIDMLYDMKTSFDDTTKTVKKLQKQFGSDVITDINSGREKLLDLYSNWEKAVQWVWSTATDAVIDGIGAVPTLGSYSPITLGAAKYEAGVYYIEDELVSETDADGNVTQTQTYKLDSSTTFDPLLSYYVENDGAYTGIKLVEDDAHVYEVSKFYTLENTNYVLSESEFDASATYYQLIEDTSQISDDWKLASPVTYNNTTYEYDTQEYRLAKFKNELTDHFNLEYLTTYFVITEVLEAYDSRGKNCMMASWGPQVAGGDYIWYPIFYDMDTQLGINNTGIPSFEYNIDATEDGTFSTNDSVLWNNFYACFKNLITAKYEQMTGVPTDTFGGSLDNPPFVDIDTIEGWYSCDPDEHPSYSFEGLRPLLALNLDEQYKYISITNAKVGYLYQDGKVTQDTSDTYFYALQGDRSMSRRQFLTNRLNYINSWLAVGDYKRGGANRIRSRISANNAEYTSDKWIEGTAINGQTDLITNEPYYVKDADGNDTTTKTHLFDGEYWITMTPVRNMYVTVGTDAANFDPIKYSGTDVKFQTSDLEKGVRESGNYREQLYYIYGLDQMKSLGDLSKLYFQEFELSGKASKMTDLRLGYDGLDESNNEYSNTNVNDWTIPAAAGTITGGMPLLKEVNLSNVRFKNNNPTFDFSSCEKLENFRNTGSNITKVTFAKGVALDTLYLANETRELQLIEARSLKNLITTYKNPVLNTTTNKLEATPGLYIQGLTDGKNTTKITTLDIQGGNLGYESYKLLKMYIDACANTAAATDRKINLTDVQWSPYIIVTDPDSYDSETSYYKDNGHFGLEPYTRSSSSDWNTNVSNGLIYEKTGDTSYEITDTDVFKELVDNTHYFSTSSSNNEIPNITGYVYINNSTDLDEGTVQEELAVKFPNLVFFFNAEHITKGYAARFVVEEDGVQTLIGTDKISKDDYTKNPDIFFTDPKDRTEANFSSTKINSLKPTKDFIGWSTTNDRNGLVESYDAIWVDTLKQTTIDKWSEQKIVEDNYDYTFYAVFEDHYWSVSFYFVNTDGSTTSAKTIKGDSIDYTAVHGSVLTDPKVILIHPNESSLPDTKRYRFIGYTKKIVGDNIYDSASEATLINFSTLKATKDTKLYAAFVEENVTDAATDEKYFSFSKVSYSHTYDSYSTSGYLVQPASGTTLAGKITIPVTYKDEPVIAIANFSNQANITGIYWYKESSSDVDSLVWIENSCFQNCTALKVFTYPSTLRAIDDYAFGLCTSLEFPNFNVCSNLMYIGSSVYNGALVASSAVSLYIPGTVVYLGQTAFSYNDNTYKRGIKELVIGSSASPTQLAYIGQQAVVQNSGEEVQDVIIYCNKSPNTVITDAVSKGYFQHTGTLTYM